MTLTIKNSIKGAKNVTQIIKRQLVRPKNKGQEQSNDLRTESKTSNPEERK